MKQTNINDVRDGEGRKRIFILTHQNILYTNWLIQVFVGIMDEAQRKNCLVRIVDIAKQNLNEVLNEIKITQSYVLAIGFELKERDLLARFLAESGLSIVFILASVSNVERIARDISYVTFSHRNASEDITTHLMNLGKKRIGFVGFDKNSGSDYLKIMGFSDALTKKGMKAKKEQIFYNNGNVKACIDAFLCCIKEFDAAFCTSDYIAYALIRIASEKGIKIPEDLAVTGFDNMYIGTISKPSLTTVAPDFTEIGRRAVQTLYSMTKKNDVERTMVYCKYNVIQRESTGSLMPNINAVRIPDGVEEDQLREIINIGGFYTDPLILQELKIDEILTRVKTFEKRIIAGIMEDKKYEDIAEELSCAIGTIKYHANKVYKCVGASSRKEFHEIMTKNVDVVSLVVALKTEDLNAVGEKV